jgi:hypothetical protein
MTSMPPYQGLEILTSIEENQNKKEISILSILRKGLLNNLDRIYIFTIFLMEIIKYIVLIDLDSKECLFSNKQI